MAEKQTPSSPVCWIDNELFLLWKNAELFLYSPCLKSLVCLQSTQCYFNISHFFFCYLPMVFAFLYIYTFRIPCDYLVSLFKEFLSEWHEIPLVASSLLFWLWQTHPLWCILIITYGCLKETWAPWTWLRQRENWSLIFWITKLKTHGWRESIMNRIYCFCHRHGRVNH